MRKKYIKGKKFNNKRGIKYIIFFSFIALLLLVTAVYIMFGKYNGLGIKQNPEHMTLDYNSFYYDKGRVFYNDGNNEGVPCIDVSEFQGKIRWNDVKNDGIDNVMIRLGFSSSDDGSLHLDACFKENLKESGREGLKRGVYFFSQATTPEDAIKEARFVVRHIRGKGIKLPVAFDMEPVYGSRRIDKLSRTKKTEIADAFCKTIKRNGFEPVIYGNPTWLNGYINLEYLTDYDLWLAHYTDYTDFNKKFIMWQYTDSGMVNGIDGYVDMNLLIKGKGDSNEN